MARRQRKSGFESLIDALAVLPWPVTLVAAPFSWLIFHNLSQLHPPSATNVGQLGPLIVATMIKVSGMALQYVAPAALLIASLASWSARRRRHGLLTDAKARASDAPLLRLSWREFEQLIGAHFEREGYSVRFTPEGADGGIDIIATKGRETYLIQCKQWRATQVGVSVVRELYGLVAAQGATGGYVVSIGAYTKDAQAFAAGRNIALLDARTLILDGKQTAPRPEAASEACPQSGPPACPQCGSTMMLRTARQGANKGQQFYGCSRYPECRGTRPLRTGKAL